jgi:hypothetical protein
MFNTMKSIITFLLFIIQCLKISCLSIHLEKNGFYHIHLKSNIHNILTINNIQYREGIFYKSLDLLFYFKQGQYNISTLYNNHFDLSVVYKQGIEKSSDCSLRKDILIKPYSQKEICKLQYYYPKKHTLELFGNFNFKNYYQNKKLILNNVIVQGPKNFIVKSDMNQINFYRKIDLPKGFHSFHIIYNNIGNNYYCNCPSIGNGFKYTKYFSSLISNNRDENNISIANNLKKNIEIISFQQVIEKNIDKYQYDISISVNNTQEVTIDKYFQHIDNYLTKFY